LTPTATNTPTPTATNTPTATPERTNGDAQSTLPSAHQSRWRGGAIV
jgi:hypothetical protein